MAILGGGDFTYQVSGDDWGSLPDGWVLGETADVAVDSRDDVYLFSRGGHPTIVFDRHGTFLRSWGEGMFANPHGITIGPDDSVFCVDNGDHTVRKFTPEGKLLMTLGSAGKPAAAMSGDPFNKPTHVAVDPRNGDFYVSDGYGNARVHKYRPDGKLLFSWGESGTGPGQMNIVHNLATDQDGRVYVGDRENQRIQVFGADGKYETQWYNMSRPAGVAVDWRGDQLVYVAEFWGGISSNVEGKRLGPRVSVLDTSGTVLARLGDEPPGPEAGRFYSPHGIAVDSRGDIYVAEVSISEYGRKQDPPQLSGLRSMQKLLKQK